MNSKLIPVYLGKDSVQMHESPHVRNIQYQNTPDCTVLIPEKPMREKLNPLWRRALGKADCQQIFSEIQDVPSLDMERVTPAVIIRNLSGIIRMIAHNKIAVYCLPAAGHGIHSVKADSASDACKRIPGKIQVRDRIEHKLPAFPCQVRQRA